MKAYLVRQAEQIQQELKEKAPDFPQSERLKWVVDNGGSISDINTILSKKGKAITKLSELLLASHLLADIKSYLKQK